MAQPTRADLLIERIKNHKILSLAIVAGVVLVGVSSVLSALGELGGWLVPLSRSPEVAEPRPVDRTMRIEGYEVTFARPYTLTNLQGYAPEWSNEGDMIAYCARNYEGPSRAGADLMISRDGGKSGEVLLASSSVKYAPKFSHDDRYVAFLAAEDAPEHRSDGQGSLMVVPTAGGEAIEIAGAGEQVVFDLNYATNYDWSPVANVLTYTTRLEVEGDPLFRLYSYDLDRGERRLLLEFDDETGPLGATLHRPQWSPDGRRIGVLNGGGGVHAFLYGTPEGGAFEHAQPVEASAAFDWLSGDEIVYDAGGAGVYRLATHRLGSRAPTYITRYEYFGQPNVARGSGLLAYYSQSERESGQWEHGFIVAPVGEPSAAEPLVTVVTHDFGHPLAEAYGAGGDSDISATVPAHLAINGEGDSALISIHERIYRIRLGS